MKTSYATMWCNAPITHSVALRISALLTASSLRFAGLPSCPLLPHSNLPVTAAAALCCVSSSLTLRTCTAWFSFMEANFQAELDTKIAENELDAVSVTRTPLTRQAAVPCAWLPAWRLHATEAGHMSLPDICQIYDVNLGSFKCWDVDDTTDDIISYYS